MRYTRPFSWRPVRMSVWRQTTPPPYSCRGLCASRRPPSLPRQLFVRVFPFRFPLLTALAPLPSVPGRETTLLNASRVYLLQSVTSQDVFTNPYLTLMCYGLSPKIRLSDVARILLTSTREQTQDIKYFFRDFSVFLLCSA